jgi:hypothetical protein
MFPPTSRTAWVAMPAGNAVIRALAVAVVRGADIVGGLEAPIWSDVTPREAGNVLEMHLMSRRPIT